LGEVETMKYKRLCFAMLICTCMYASILEVPVEFGDIQSAVDSAAVGDTVLIHPGTYLIQDSIGIKSKNLVIGSLMLTTRKPAYLDKTILKGNGNNSIFCFWEGVDTSTIITGLTLTEAENGIYCDNASPQLDNLNVSKCHSGAGIFLHQSNPLIRWVRIDYCQTGIYCWWYSKPRIENCTILDNSRQGILCNLYSPAEISHCLIMRNGDSGIECSTYSDAQIHYVLVESNYDSGIFCSLSSPTIMNSIIRSNHGRCGAGILIKWKSNPYLKDVVITRNQTSSWGAGVACMDTCNAIFDHVTIAQNISTGKKGGGIYLWKHANPVLRNVTITGNSTGEGGGIYISDYCYPVVVNTILWENYPDEICFNIAKNGAVISRSLVKDGQVIRKRYSSKSTFYWLDDNIEGEPGFTNEWGLDYSLMKSSACVDAGTPFFAWEGDTIINLSDDDFNGNAPDIGAIESAFVVGLDEENPLPSEISLLQNYPNPFNSQTNIRFELPQSALVKLTILDLAGKELEILVNRPLSAGCYTFQWDADRYSSGVYIYQITVNRMAFYRKCLLCK